MRGSGRQDRSSSNFHVHIHLAVFKKHTHTSSHSFTVSLVTRDRLDAFNKYWMGQRAQRTGHVAVTCIFSLSESKAANAFSLSLWPANLSKIY